MFKRVLCTALALGLALAFTSGPLLADEPANLDLYKEPLKVYVNSGEYAKRVAEVALQANKYLVKRIARGAKPGKKLAVVFDIDETTLSNLPHVIANDYGYVPKVWDTWVLEAQARAIIPVQTIYDTAVRGKVDVFFITARPESARASTEKNLREVGYETWTRIFYKPATDLTLTTTGLNAALSPALPPGAGSGDSTRSLHSPADAGLAGQRPNSTRETPPQAAGNVSAFKTDVRRKLTQEGYVIVINIGDQYSDLAGGYAERIYKLPNPFYIVK